MGNQHLVYFSCLSLMLFNNLFTVQALQTHSAKSTFENKTEDYSQCGKVRRVNTRYVNPSQQVPRTSDWPWMAAVLDNIGEKSHWICDGTLISKQWLIVPERCVEKVTTAKELTVEFGGFHFKDSDDDRLFTVDVKEIIRYSKSPSVSPNVTYIALVKLAKKVHFTESLRPICILNEEEYKRDTFYHDKTPFFVGSTTPITNDVDSVETILKDAETEIVDNDKCSKFYNRNEWDWPIDPKVLCVKNKKDYTCHGETGGALILPLNTTFYLVGITLGHVECDSAKPPAIFARIPYFADWIKKHTGL